MKVSEIIGVSIISVITLVLILLIKFALLPSDTAVDTLIGVVIGIVCLMVGWRLKASAADSRSQQINRKNVLKPLPHDERAMSNSLSADTYDYVKNAFLWAIMSIGLWCNGFMIGSIKEIIEATGADLFWIYYVISALLYLVGFYFLVPNPSESERRLKNQVKNKWQKNK